MSFTIAVAQRKGGVGKTTLAISLAAELFRRWRPVALIDTDAQQSASQWAKPGNLQFPVYEHPIADQAISNWVRDFNRVAMTYEYIVIDSAPNERALGTSIAVSDLVLVPCTPSGLDIEATTRTLEIIDMVRQRRPKPLNLLLVPNRVDSRTLEGRQLVEELAGFGEIVSPTIGNRSTFVRAFSAGKSVADMPEGHAAHREIEQLCSLVEKFIGGILPSPRKG